MRVFNRKQGIFVGIITFCAGLCLASFLFYLFNGYSLIKVIRYWRFSAVFQGAFYPDVLPYIRLMAYKAFGFGFIIAGIIPIGMLVQLNNTSGKKLFGDARFQTLGDIMRCKSISYGKNGSKGFVVGLYKDKLLRYTQDDFVSLSAGTRSGKGAAVVIPNLLEWQGSIVINDIKQECFKITSRYRQEVLQNKIYLIDPFSEKSHGFNPLVYIDLTNDNGNTALMGIAEIIFPTDGGRKGAELFYNETCQGMFIGYCKALYLLREYKLEFLLKQQIEPIFSIGTMLDLFHRTDLEELGNTVIEILNEHLLDKPILYQVAMDSIDKLKAYAEQDGETRATMIGTFEKQLKLFALPTFRRATDRNDVDFRQLRREKITIYLGVLPENVKIASLFLNLFWNTLIRVQLTENPDFVPGLKYNLAGILDEFPAIGKIPYIKDAAGYMAGYKMQLLTISQNQSQLKELYGADGVKSLMANHSCKIIYAVSENDDAELYSKELGNITDKSRNKSHSRSWRSGASYSDSMNETKRALMLPQELKTLPDDEEIILLKGVHPIRCNKAYYFNNRYFMDKLIQLSPTLQQIQKKLGRNQFPSKEDLGMALAREELEVQL